MLKHIWSITAILFACLIWGMIFVVPLFLSEYTPFEVALGRFGAYSIVSIFYLLYYYSDKIKVISIDLWKKAIVYGIIANLIYYTSLVFGMRYANPPLAALILGLSPITVSLYGNWSLKEYDMKVLLFPSIMILIGLFLVNYKAFESSSNTIWHEYLLGLFFIIIAEAIWTWFAVTNAKTLKEEKELTGDLWAAMIGTTLLPTILVFWLAIQTLPIGEPILYSRNWVNFIIGSSILGIVCSWLAISLWNRGSSKLPVSFAGQLLIFETIFGLLFVYIYEWTFPEALELSGIAFMLAAIVISTRALSKPAIQEA